MGARPVRLTRVAALTRVSCAATTGGVAGSYGIRRRMRQPDVADLLRGWQQSTTAALEQRAGLTAARAQQFFLLLIGLAHLDQVHGTDVRDDATESEVAAILEGRLHDRSSDR